MWQLTGQAVPLVASVVVAAAALEQWQSELPWLCDQQTASEPWPPPLLRTMTLLPLRRTMMKKRRHQL